MIISCVKLKSAPLSLTRPYIFTFFFMNGKQTQLSWKLRTNKLKSNPYYQLVKVFIYLFTCEK